MRKNINICITFMIKWDTHDQSSRLIFKMVVLTFNLLTAEAVIILLHLIHLICLAVQLILYLLQVIEEQIELILTLFIVLNQLPYRWFILVHSHKRICLFLASCSPNIYGEFHFVHSGLRILFGICRVVARIPNTVCAASGIVLEGTASCCSAPISYWRLD